MTDVNISSVDTQEEFGKPPEGIAKRWKSEIDLFETQNKDWFDCARDIEKLYRNEKNAITAIESGFPLFWSNIETLKPVVYAKSPKPIVQRRFKDSDPVARVASEIATRAVSYSVDRNDIFDSALRECTEDYLLVAQGVSWQRYCPHFKKVAIKVPLTPVSPEIAEEGEQVSNDVYADDEGKQYSLDDEGVEPDQAGGATLTKQDDILDYEEVIEDYINWRDFGFNSGARTWSEVYAVWRIAFMTREELVERFGKEIGEAIPLDFTPDGMDKQSDDVKELFKKARVYEIWNKQDRKLVWIHKSYADPLDQKNDPLGLEEFFPCPRPMFGTTTNGKLQGVPDYLFYRSQHREINDLTQRIANIEKALRVRGFYPGNVQDFQVLMENAADNDMIPIDQAIIMQMGGDMSKMIWFWPLDLLASTLKELIEMRGQLIQDVYQITGLSDILRGESDPNETATAQNIKSQWGSLRVRDKQKEVARYARDAVRLRFQIIFNLFQDDTIMKMADVQQITEVAKNPQIAQQAMTLLRDNAMRSFRIDIETDSTVEPDDQAEKQSVNELLAAIGGFVQQAGEALMTAPELAPALGQTMMMAMRRYRAGEQVEQAWETALTQLQTRLSQPQPPAPQEQQGPTPQELQLQAADLQERAQHNQGLRQIKGAEIQQRTQEGQAKTALAAQQQEIDKGHLLVDAYEASKPDPQPTTVQ